MNKNLGAGWKKSQHFTHVKLMGTIGLLLGIVDLAHAATVVNQPPTATAQVVATDEDKPLAITLQGVDPEKKKLSYKVISQPKHGSVVAINGAKVTYTPQLDYFNTASTADTFTFTVNDGALDSKPATVSVQVNAVNDPPNVQDQAVSLDENTSAVLTVIGSDVDTNPAALTYEMVKSPKKGTVDNLGKGQFKYKPQANFAGTDSFTVVANDGVAKSKPATLTLTVRAVNNPPIALAQTVGLLEDKPQNITLKATDVDSPTLTYKVTTPQHGQLTCTAQGACQYTPNANYAGTDSFTFTASDGSLTSNVATVSLNITPVNDAPIANDQKITVESNVSTDITLTGSDADGQTLTFDVPLKAKKGTLTPVKTGVYRYNPPKDYVGADSFSFTVSDGLVKSKPATVTLTVQAAALQTGQFVGPTVAGLSYTTATQSGSTTAKGEFVYKAGEQITFKVGDIVLGTVAAAPQVTVFTLAGITNPPVQAIDINREINRLNSNVMPTPFEVATNLAVFLQTLDDDFNAANGIVIPSQLQTIAQGSKVEFRSRQVKLKDFAQSYPLRYLIGSGRLAGLWGGKRPIRNYKYALDNVYSALGLTPQIYAPVKYGSRVYTYDAQGNLKTDIVNNQYTIKTTYNYDSDGNVIQTDVDYSNGLSGSNHIIYTYDSNGYKIFVKNTQTSSSGNMSISSVSNQYDNYGNKIDDYSYFNNSLTAHTHYIYDQKTNQLIITSVDSSDGSNPPDGIEDYRTNYQYTYNALGNVIKQIVSYSNISGIYVNEYDDDGNLINNYAMENNILGFGSYFYYKNKCLVKKESYSASSVNIIGTANYVCDGQGNIINRTSDNSNDGVTDDEAKWQFDAIGNLLQRTEKYKSGLTTNVTLNYDATTGNLLNYGDSTNYSYLLTNKWSSQSIVQPFSSYLANYVSPL